MAVAAPARKTAPAPAPSRTTPPRRRPAPARPATRSAPRSRPAPARRAPQRKQPTGVQPKLALAVGRTAVAVGQLPDSGLVVRLTRGRAWIGVLGVLLVGIVALNVLTLSFATSSGAIAQDITALSKENSVLGSRVAQRYSTERIRYEAGAAGMFMPNVEDPVLIEAGRDDLATAAARLAAAGPG
ncbi:MAG TPA: hypothetical protein VF121_04840 [Thermoanaerobaculia bacterium]|nr:hypothetical protein [Thermoanaerobaculia bacterium]